MNLMFQRIKLDRVGILIATLVLLFMGKQTMAEDDVAAAELKQAQVHLGSSYSLEISGVYEAYDLAELNQELARATDAAMTSFASTYASLGYSLDTFSSSTTLSQSAMGVGFKFGCNLESGWNVFLQSQLTNGAAFSWKASSTGTPVGTITRKVSGNVSYFPIYFGLSRKLQLDHHILEFELAMGPAFSRGSFGMGEERRGGSLNVEQSAQYDYYGTGIASRASVGYAYLLGSSGFSVGLKIGYHLLKIESLKSAHDIDFDHDGVLEVRKDQKWLSSSGLGYPVSLDFSGLDCHVAIERNF